MAEAYYPAPPCGELTKTYDGAPGNNYANLVVADADEKIVHVWIRCESQAADVRFVNNGANSEAFRLEANEEIQLDVSCAEVEGKNETTDEATTLRVVALIRTFT